MMRSPSGRPTSSAASTPTSKCCYAEPSTTPEECQERLDPFLNVVVHPPRERSQLACRVLSYSSGSSVNHMGGFGGRYSAGTSSTAS
jgi:hypothetical protein